MLQTGDEADAIDPLPEERPVKPILPLPHKFSNHPPKVRKNLSSLAVTKFTYHDVIGSRSMSGDLFREKEEGQKRNVFVALPSFFE